MGTENFIDVSDISRPYITIVSGLPRSGTSMMMNMLEAGGLQILTDGIRTADVSNPNGYFELERVRDLQRGDRDWIGEMDGRGMKVISTLLHFLPPEHQYRVLFMRRELREILSSQAEMLHRQGKPELGIGDADIAEIYQEHLESVEQWLEMQPNFEVLQVNYNDLLSAPLVQVDRVSQFLGGELERDVMLGVISPRLYRKRELPD